MNKPLYLPADLYEQVLTFIAGNAESQEALGVGNSDPGRDDVVIGLGGTLDVWSEDHRVMLEAA